MGLMPPGLSCAMSVNNQSPANAAVYVGQQPMRILIADDDANSRALIAKALRNMGHQAIEAKDGRAALELLCQPDGPALAILDWMMPDIDGLDVVRRLRAVPDERPRYLIMLTAKNGTDDIVTGLNAGADDYLTKPFKPGELCARIEVGRRMLTTQSALLDSRSRLLFEATHDPLTQIWNRRAILERLQAEVARRDRHGDELAIGMCDVDHFKAVNDVHGHLIGDEVLRGVTRVLSENMREYDLIGRMGGEEFLIMLPLLAGRDPLGSFARLCQQCAAADLPTAAGPLSVTLSIGVACAADCRDAQRVLAAADRALYRAKEGGRNRAVLAEPDWVHEASSIRG